MVFLRVHVVISYNDQQNAKIDIQHKYHTALSYGIQINKRSNHDSVTSYLLRDTESKLAIPQSHTNYLKNSFGYRDYRGVVLCNSLPMEMRQANTLHSFKTGCTSQFVCYS